MADLDPASQDNQDGEDRPDWLPENFAKPEDLAASYKEAQRKITEESTARAQEATARRNLEDLVAQQQALLEQHQSNQPEADPNEWYAAFEQDPIATQRALAEQAAAAAVKQYAEQQQQHTQPYQNSQAEIVADLAFRHLENTRPVTQELRAEMANIANQFPHLIPEDAAQSPQKLAASLGILADLAERKLGPQENTMSNEDIMRTMKVNAQSATGAGGRPSPEDAHAARWTEIVNAKTDSLGL